MRTEAEGMRAEADQQSETSGVEAGEQSGDESEQQPHNSNNTHAKGSEAFVSIVPSKRERAKMSKEEVRRLRRENKKLAKAHNRERRKNKMKKATKKKLTKKPNSK